MEQLRELINQDKAALTALEALSAAGGTVYVVGGAVRDSVLGGSPKDIDLMVAGLTGEAIEDALAGKGRLDFTGKQFGVYRLKVGGDEVEIAMPRAEVSTGPMHTDFAIEANPLLSPEEDMNRRDFTGNAMAYNPVTGELIDPFGGQDDLKNGRLRLVSPDSFRDDPLRIVRALTAAARQGLEPDESVIESMREHGAKIRHLPGERIQMEMDKLLAGSNPARAIEIAFETGLMEYMAPELASIADFDQRNPHHDLTVDKHTLQVLRKMSELTNDPDLRLAALFHDSGKPDSFWLDENAPEGGGGHFYKKIEDDGTVKGADHEEVGAELVEAFMRRLRYPNKRIERVRKLVAMHMFPYFTNERGARKFIQAAGDPKMAFDLLLLRESDASGKREGTMNEFDSTNVQKARELVQTVLDKEEAFGIRDLKIDGHDLMGLGYKGPEIGKALNMLLEAVIADPTLNTKERLLALLQDSLPQPITKVALGPVWEAEIQPWRKWSYDGQKLTIWPVNPKTGRPHHIEVTGMNFYKLAQGRVYVDWGAGQAMGGLHDDYVEIFVWEDRGTIELQDAAVEEVEKWVYAQLGRAADEVTYQDEGIDWTQLGRDPDQDEIDKFYFGLEENDPDDPTETVIEPQEEEEPDYRSFHNLTDAEWRLIDEDSPYEYLDNVQ